MSFQEDALSALNNMKGRFYQDGMTCVYRVNGFDLNSKYHGLGAMVDVLWHRPDVWGKLFTPSEFSLTKCIKGDVDATPEQIERFREAEKRAKESALAEKAGG